MDKLLQKRLLVVEGFQILETGILYKSDNGGVVIPFNAPLRWVSVLTFMGLKVQREYARGIWSWFDWFKRGCGKYNKSSFSKTKYSGQVSKPGYVL
jgi:hypothetical protein